MSSVGSIKMKEATSHITVLKVIHLIVDLGTAQNSVDILLSIYSSFLLYRPLLFLSYSWAPEKAGPIPGMKTGPGGSNGTHEPFQCVIGAGTQARPSQHMAFPIRKNDSEADA